MNRRSALALAGGAVAAIATAVTAAVITFGAPAVADGQRHKVASLEPRVRTVTHTITIHKHAGGSPTPPAVVAGGQPSLMTSPSRSDSYLAEDEGTFEGMADHEGGPAAADSSSEPGGGDD
jgi:hypothetical protein